MYWSFIREKRTVKKDVTYILQTFAKYRMAMSWGKDEMSGMEEDYDRDKDEKS